MAPSSPVGLELNKRWSVGRFLAGGAQGSVHALVNTALDNTESDEWVVKLAPKPEANKTGKKAKLMQQNANSIYSESVMYQIQLVDLLGTMIPKVPISKLSHDPPVFLDKQDYCFLCMERMECTLEDALPSLLLSSKIDLGSIATRLIDIVEAIHERRHVIVDVKLDNFMLAKGKGPLSSRLRLLDLGLLQAYRFAGGQRLNDKAGSLQGTPLYTSLAVHALETPSRRDDLEAIAYLVAELVIQIQAHIEGSHTERNSTANKVVADFLPWSQAQSDDELYKIKKSMVENMRSDFYKSLPKAIADRLQQYLHEVWSYDFKAKPNYDKLRSLFSILTMDVATKKKSRKSASTSLTPTRTTRSSRKTIDEDDKQTDKTTPKKRRSSVKKNETCDVSDKETSTRKSTRKSDSSKKEASSTRVTRSTKQNAATTQRPSRSPSPSFHSVDQISDQLHNVAGNENAMRKEPFSSAPMEIDSSCAEFDDDISGMYTPANLSDQMQSSFHSTEAMNDSSHMMPPPSNRHGRHKANREVSFAQSPAKSPRIEESNRDAAAHNERMATEANTDMDIDSDDARTTHADGHVGCCLKIIGGPSSFIGNCYEFWSDKTKTVLIGSRRPTRDLESDEACVVLDHASVDDQHCTIVLFSNSNNPTKVLVNSLSSSGIGVMSKSSSKDGCSVTKDVIKIGDIILQTYRVEKQAKQVEHGPVADAQVQGAGYKEVEASDTEEYDDENENPILMSPIVDSGTKEQSKAAATYSFFVEEGPHKGQSIPMNLTDTVVIGSNPSGKGNTIALYKDDKLQKNHVKLSLTEKKSPRGGKSLIKISVKPYQDNSVYIGATAVKKSGTVVMYTDKIRLGSTVLSLKRD